MAALGELSVRSHDVGGAVADAVRADPADWLLGRRHVVLFVHGFNNSLAAARASYEGVFTTALADVGYFYWPGDTRGGAPISSLSYPFQIRNAQLSARLLADYLGGVFGPGGGPSAVSFVGHSLGCRLVLEALRTVRDQGLPWPEVRLVALMAAASPTDLVQPGQVLEAAAHLPHDLALFYSAADRVLHFAFPLGQAAAFGLGIEAGDYRQAVGRFGQPAGLTLDRFETSLDHGQYWPSDTVAAHVAQLQGTAVPAVLPIRSLALATLPAPRLVAPPRPLPNRPLMPWDGPAEVPAPLFTDRPPTPSPPPPPRGPVPFAPVLDAELAQVRKRREARKLAKSDRPSAAPALEQARELGLVGLAFSGGGIRSATFNLGFLQGLAGLRLLKYFDYLSTVSGGGYIGAWFAAWAKRDGIKTVETDLKPRWVKQAARQAEGAGATDAGPHANGESREPAPLRHLRRHTNYLAPREGFLSADRWVLWATYLRNFLLNQLALLPTALAVVVLSRLVMFFYFPEQTSEEPAASFGQFVLVAVLTGVFASAALVLAFGAVGRVRPREPIRAAARPHTGDLPARGAGWALTITVLFLLAVIAFCYLTPYRLDPAWGWTRGGAGTWLSELLAFAGYATVVVLVSLGVASRFLPHAYLPVRIWPAIMIPVAAAGGIVAGAALYGIYRLLHWFFVWDGTQSLGTIAVQATAEVTTFGPPLALLGIVVAVSLGVGLLRRQLRDELREWWASLCGRLLVAGAVWASVNFISLYGTALILWIGPWARTAVASGWLATVAGGVLAGGSMRSGPLHPQGSARQLFIRVAFHVFVAGILVLVSLLAHVLLDNPPHYESASNDALPWRREPDHPATRITRTRAGLTGSPRGQRPTSVREHKEYQVIPDDGEIVRQTYWLGMLNTDPHFCPTVRYTLDGKAFTDLERIGIPECVVAPLRQASWDNLDRNQFEDRLNALLPEGDYMYDREKILLRARDVQVIDVKPGRLFAKLAAWVVGLIALLFVAGRCIDVNLFSLHGLYGNRLVRAYLGASRPGRTPDPVTGFDPDDDLPLQDLGRGYEGPYPLVNVALNIVHGEELAWQERKAESFVLTPLYCGSETTGYRRTAAGYGGDVTLGTAVTISGAAASPNMGYHSSAAVTFLLTVFNARLGAWLGNPHEATWREPGPRNGLLHLFMELFGWTNDRGPYVYLSDGGHFENLAVYELVRRRCQYVVVCDAGQDAGHTFEDLGNLIRKVRIDLGIRIEIAPDCLRLQGEPRRCRWHCAIGTIRYGDVDKNAAPGTLVYVKPSLTGDEPADVLDYAAEHGTFPHETTANQFYTESQFESYRALGQHVAEAVFTQPVADMEEEIGQFAPADPAGAPHRARCRSLFAALKRRWFAMPPAYEASFVESTKSYSDVQAALRKDPRLWRLTLELYPELDPDGEAARQASEESAETRAARRGAEVHVLNQMLQAMENAYLSLNLEVNYAHPLNRGWLDVYHRWTSAPTFRHHWPLVRSEFGRDFVSFCEKQMRLGVVKGAPVLLRRDGPPHPLERLLLEFEDQWPGRRTQVLKSWLKQAEQGQTWAWLIYPDNPYPEPPKQRPARQGNLPRGLIVVAPAREKAGGPAPGDVYEVLVWVRGAYRNTGLGRTAFQAVLNHHLPKLLPLPFVLQTRLPVGHLTGPGGKLQKAMWLTFFTDCGFKTVKPDAATRDAGRKRDVVLEYRCGMA